MAANLVYDIDDGGVYASAFPPPKAFIDNVKSFQDLGFKLGSKAKLEDVLTSSRPFDAHRPDATLVSRGDVAGSPLKNGVAFLFAEGAPESIIVHIALAHDTSTEACQKVMDDFKGFFYKDPNETDSPYYGYLSLEKEKPQPDGIKKFDNPFEYAATKFRDMGVNTVPLRASPLGVGMLPIFSKEGRQMTDLKSLPLDKNLRDNVLQKNIASVLTEHLGSQVFGVNMNEFQRDVAVEIQERLRIVEAKERTHIPESGMRMSMR